MSHSLSPVSAFQGMAPSLFTEGHSRCRIRRHAVFESGVNDACVAFFLRGQRLDETGQLAQSPGLLDVYGERSRLFEKWCPLQDSNLQPPD